MNQMMMSDIEESFAAAIVAAQSIDFPNIARQLGTDWVKTLKPRMIECPAFKSAIEESLEELRLIILSKIFEIGNGKMKGNANVQCCKFILECIQDGTVLGLPVVKEEKKPSSNDKDAADEGVKLTPEQEEAHLSRLNLILKENADPKS